MASLADRPWQEHITQYGMHEMPTEGFVHDLVKLVKEVAWKYPPSLYAPLDTWDRDAYWTVAIDVLEKQIKNGHLKKLYGAQAVSSQIYSHLRWAIKWHLGDIAESRGDRLALYRRAESILKADETFWYCAAREGWGLVAWRSEQWKSSDEALSSQHLETTELPCTLTSERRKGGLPPRTDFARFIRTLLEVVGHPVRLRQIVQAACAHFGVVDTAQCQWPVNYDKAGNGHPLEIADSSPGADTIAILKELLKQFYKDLTPQDRILFREYRLNGRKQTDLRQVGLQKSAVSNHIRQIETRFEKLPVKGYSTSLVESTLVEVIEELKAEAPSYGPITNRQSVAKAADSNSKAAVRCRRGNRSGNPRATVRGAT